MKLKTMISNSSSHSHLRASLSSSSSTSPRSFLVKKYLKQKFENDFKLQESLKAELASPSITDSSRICGGKVDNVGDDIKVEQSQAQGKICSPPITPHKSLDEYVHQSDLSSDHYTTNNCSSSPALTNGFSSGDSSKCIKNNVSYRTTSSYSPSPSHVAATSLSSSAAAPQTPKFPQPVAVMLSNGYIIDFTALRKTQETEQPEETLKQERAEHADHVTARSPNQAYDSASVEIINHFNQQLLPHEPPRRNSVIVSNSSHPANRRFPVDNSHAYLRHHPYAVSGSSRSNVEASAVNRYVASPNQAPSACASVPFEESENYSSLHAQHSRTLPQYSSHQLQERRSSSSSTPTPPPAHLPSPPPAHTPITNLLPRHLSPAPAHTSSSVPFRVASMPSPAHKSQTPPPAHSTSHVVPPNFLLNHRPLSPTFQHSQTHAPQTSPAGDVIPADHPIHHPLVQQLINQRLHVPDKSLSDSSMASNDNIRETYPVQVHKPNTRPSDNYNSDEVTPISPPHQDSDVIYNYDNHQNFQGEGDNNRTHSDLTRFVTARQSYTQREIKMLGPEENCPTSFTENTSTPTYSMNFSLNTTMPPSPSPSLPSASPSHLSSSCSTSSVFQTSPQAGSPALLPERDQTDTDALNTSSTTYTYEAFLVSDGRSRKRSVTSVSSEGSVSSDVNPSQVNGRARYTCGECGKDYATSSNLSRHKQTHRSLDSKNAKKCPHCDKVYVSMPALSMHILTHDLKHPCTICGKNFSRPWLLQGHMRSHTGEKPFGCAHCGKAFADRSNLRAHMQTHSAFKHFSCDKCHKTFALKSYLNKHLESACVKDQD